MGPVGSGVSAAAGVPLAAMAATAAAAPPAGAGAVAVPVAATAAAAPPAGAAAAARPATNWRNARVKWAKVLFILGCAAAALAIFAVNSTTADSRRVPGACVPTDAEAAALRAASEKLLVAAAAQVVGATTAVLVPARPVAVFASLLGWLTGYRAPRVLWTLVACDADVVLAIYYWLFVAVMWVAYLVGALISVA